MNVYMLLDRSGSMETLWKEAINSINAYVENLPTNANVYLAVFDSQSYDVVRYTSAKEWKNVDPTEFEPRGGTPLYDSAVRMFWRAFDDNPERAAFVVMTDGEENFSKNFRKQDVKVLIDKAEQKNWQVIFLGANFDKVSDQAYSVGLKNDRFMNITPGNMVRSMNSLASYTTAYAASGAEIRLSDADKTQASL